MSQTAWYATVFNYRIPTTLPVCSYSSEKTLLVYQNYGPWWFLNCTTPFAHPGAECPPHGVHELFACTLHATELSAARETRTQLTRGDNSSLTLANVHRQLRNVKLKCTESFLRLTIYFSWDFNEDARRLLNFELQSLFDRSGFIRCFRI